MTTKITAANLDSTLSTTISQGGGPKITNIQITDNAYTVLDDTAVDLAGGYIKISGTGFATGCQVLIGTTSATSTTFVSATEVRAQVPAMTAGTYIVYLVNSDGGVSIRVNGLTYSASPTWSTNSLLTTQIVDQAISIQLSAAGATTYSLAAGSSLPAGLTLTSGGLLAGTVTGLIADTTYTFTVLATDTENQDSPRSFSLLVTIIVVDPYFNQVSLLLPGTGANNATNNTFLDSSTNNFTITRNGNTTQGTWSPYSPAGWSNYFDGSGDYLSTSTSPATLSGNFTIEGWLYLPSLSASQPIVCLGDDYQTTGVLFYISNTGKLGLYGNNSAIFTGTSQSLLINSWNHVAFVRSSNTIKAYLNGVADSTTASNSTAFTGICRIGKEVYNVASELYMTGYISNFRIVNGTAVYTSNFTPPTAPLTAIANTSLLACQSNRFVDNSTNNFAITANGDVKVTNSAPFAPTVPWSAATHGGSAYFDGSGDYLSLPTSSAFALTSTTAWTVECWVYLLTLSTAPMIMTIGIYGQTINVRCAIGTDGKLNYMSGSDSWGWTAEANSSNAVALNSWNHCVWTRSGNTLQMYINGVQGYNATFNFGSGNSGNVYIASYFGNNLQMLTGYISNFRCVLGTSVYTTNFTPPTAPVTAIANTSLLLNATNAAITDAATRNVLETVGDAKISTVQSKWGGGSMSFDGTGDWLTAPNNINLQLGTDNFTIEFWVYLGATGAARGFVGKGGASTGWLVSATSSNTVQFTYGSSTITSTGTLAGSTWYHIAVVRQGTGSNQTKIYINGTNDGTGTVSTDFNQTEVMYVGANRTGGDALNGYIQDLRITKGVARYTANFTPPAKALPTQ